MTDKEKKLVKEAVVSIFDNFNILEHTACLGELRDDILRLINSMPEEPISEEFEKALAEEWQGYVDRGAATVDALEDNTQELAFAKGFYRGANWQKEQMIAKAVDALVHTFDNGYIRVGTQLLANNEYGLKMGDKVKVIVIKEE